jgi:hypothetical protein
VDDMILFSPASPLEGIYELDRIHDFCVKFLMLLSPEAVK